MTHSLARLAALALLASGCDGARPSTPATPPATPPAPATDPAPATPPVPAPDATRTLELPDGVCTIAAPGFRGDGLVLRLAPDGPAFATVGRRGIAGLLGTADPRRSAELVIPNGPAVGLAVFGLRVETEHVALRGFVDPAAIELRPLRAVVHDEFLVPTRLRVAAAAPNDLGVMPHVPDAVELFGPAPVQHLACGDVALGPGELDLGAVLPAARDPDARAELRPGDHDLSVEPGSAPVARLHLTEADVVRVLETRGKSTRIAWSQGGVTVFGWVPAKALARLPAGVRRKGEEGSMAAPFGEETSLATLVCREDVPLVADVAGERVTVGQIKPGTRVSVRERSATHAVIAAPRGPDGLLGPASPDITPSLDATFLVPAPALERCTPAAP